jgi:ssRNA-specific RNase YbeY (16S rRNA maturation enzyme)
MADEEPYKSWHNILLAEYYRTDVYSFCMAKNTVSGTVLSEGNISISVWKTQKVNKNLMWNI